MSNNQYFLVNKINNQSYFIIQGPMQLPDSFGPTSGFSLLEEKTPELLSDLTWQNNPNLGFWKGNFTTKPDYSISQSLVPNNSLDTTNKTCDVTYTIKTLSSQELSERIDVLKSQIRMIRDKYLALTDFTQLPDVPFSSDAKSQFATFRQQLRDLPNASDPTTITWPSIPTIVDINLPPFPPVPTYKI